MMKNLFRAGLVTGAAIAAMITAASAGRADAPPQAKASPTVDWVMAQIQGEEAALIKPRKITLTSEKALAAREAIKKGDFEEAEKITAEVLSHSQIQNWRFYPFNIFITSISDKDDPAYLDKLNAWVDKEKGSALPYLIRAEYFEEMAWHRRGERFRSEIQQHNFLSFEEYRVKALADTVAAIKIDGNNPFAWYLKLRIASDGGDSKAVAETFNEAIGQFPTYYPLYDLRLKSLEPKWGGSTDQMAQFVAEYADRAEKNSPLKMLYLNLFARFIDASWISCEGLQRQVKECVERNMDPLDTHQLEDKVQESLDLYNHTDKHQYNIVVQGLFDDMVSTPGSERYVGALLQIAADMLGSDNQLQENNPGHNNYIFDLITAHVWSKAQYSDNAENKYKEALKDIESAPFPGEEEKDVALAAIYEEMAGFYDRNSQFANAIIYQEAAEAMGGRLSLGFPHLKCHAWYKLKEYQKAVDACSTVVNDTGELEARFWRARSYIGLDKGDDALKDLQILADSESRFRESAAIDMTVIYGKRNELKKELEIFDKYPYLFDESAQEPENLAVAYNNRCYAYLHLDQLEKAQSDCATSLRYGSIPDAYQKQQEIIRRLKKHEKGI